MRDANPVRAEKTTMQLEEPDGGGLGGLSFVGGTRTLSMTWTTPLVAGESANATFALLIMTPDEFVVTFNLEPSTVTSCCPLVRLALIVCRNKKISKRDAKKQWQSD